MAKDLKAALRSLQDDFAELDMLTRPSKPNAYEFLVKRHQQIAIRMDGNRNHKRPHIHIDYGQERHVASYAIDNGERLSGTLNNKYDRLVHAWIGRNRRMLVHAWQITQSGQKPEAVIAQLKASVVR